MKNKRKSLFLLFFFLIGISIGLIWISDNQLSVFPSSQNTPGEASENILQDPGNLTRNIEPSEVSSTNVTVHIIGYQQKVLQQIPIENTSDGIEKNYVTIENARNNAFLALVQLLYLESLGPGVIQQDKIQFYPEPVIIFDATGKILLYEFYAGPPGQKNLVMDIAASRVWGTPIIRVGENAKRPADPESITHLAQDIVDSEYPEYSIDHAKFLCYAYPLTGLEIYLTKKNDSEKKRIFITPWGMENDRYMQSYYDRIPGDEYPKRVTEWEQSNNRNLKLTADIQNAGINLSHPYNVTNSEKIRTILRSEK
jgi:hypothetical protein